MAQKKIRNFCFTVNNWNEDDIETIKNIDSKYLIIGKEVGESGTPHLQCYVMFKNARSIKRMIKVLPGHVEISKGSPLQNFEYCSKEGDFIEIGCRP